jgi:hypothetical protein
MIGDHDGWAARYGESAIEEGIAWRSRISPPRGILKTTVTWVKLKTPFIFLGNGVFYRDR